MGCDVTQFVWSVHNQEGVTMKTLAFLCTASALMGQVAINSLGPLPESVDGNGYLLVEMDYFPKWPEAATQNGGGHSSQCLYERILWPWREPIELHSDQGQNFESTLSGEVYEILGTHKTRTTPLQTQSDGMVEYYNVTIKAQLSIFVEEKQKD